MTMAPPLMPGQAPEPTNRFSDPDAWRRLLSGLGLALSSRARGGTLSEGFAGGAANYDAQQRQRQQDERQARRDQLDEEEIARRQAEEARKAESAKRIQSLLMPPELEELPVRQIGDVPGRMVGGAQRPAGNDPLAGLNLSPVTRKLLAQAALDDPDGALNFLLSESAKGPEKPKTTDDLTEYEFYKSQGGTDDFTSWMRGNKKASASNTTVTVGGETKSDAKQREALATDEGKRWSQLQEAGTTAGGLGQDFQALDQLLTVAPQGPIEGNLAAVFPGFSKAGDAFTSVVTRVAPSLRTPGSGATSDIEYEGMLKSLPRLGNTPEGNRAIAEMMKAKAALNIERAEIITAYQNEEIDVKEARSQLAALNKESILTPELQQALKGVGVDVGGGASAPDPDGWQTIDGVRIRVKPAGAGR
jgi:hypothetical protein